MNSAILCAATILSSFFRLGFCVDTECYVGFASEGKVTTQVCQGKLNCKIVESGTS